MNMGFINDFFVFKTDVHVDCAVRVDSIVALYHDDDYVIIRTIDGRSYTVCLFDKDYAYVINQIIDYSCKKIDFKII